MEWSSLDMEKKEEYFQVAEQMNKHRSLSKNGLIEDLNKRRNELNKQIKELRKIVS